ncbi:MAG: hypothetical protein Q7T20_01145, partial [Saprospiraceae bacterium]|nr:hypothetical protein [Saprospiraceae bacterium]
NYRPKDKVRRRVHCSTPNHHPKGEVRKQLYFANKCFFKKALPDPVFKYCSNSKALVRSGNAQHHVNRTGSLSFVMGTQPFWCRVKRSRKLLVHPVYNWPSLQVKT